MNKFEQRITSLKVMIPIAIIVILFNIWLLKHSGWFYELTPTEYDKCIKDVNKLLTK